MSAVATACVGLPLPAETEDHRAADAIARAAATLRGELETYPKPGLASPVDTGSHADMDADTFRASAAAITPFLAALASAGATGGVNTHCGAIFGLGLLCVATRARPRAGEGTLGRLVRVRYGAAILGGPVLLHAPGARARRRHGVGGAQAEAAAGFPTLYRVGLPALRRGRQRRSDDPQAARVEACLALIAHLEDSCLLHRGGPEGYVVARAEAARFIAEGGVGQPDWRERAERLHRAFVSRNVSPGGAADLLAMTLFLAQASALRGPAARRIPPASAAGRPAPDQRPHGAPVFDERAGLDKRARQIPRTIDRAACLEACREYGADTVLDLGPGHALATMAWDAMPSARVHALDEFRTASGAADWLRGR